MGKALAAKGQKLQSETNLVNQNMQDMVEKIKAKFYNAVLLNYMYMYFMYAKLKSKTLKLSTKPRFSNWSMSWEMLQKTKVSIFDYISLNGTLCKYISDEQHQRLGSQSVPEIFTRIGNTVPSDYWAKTPFQLKFKPEFWTIDRTISKTPRIWTETNRARR